MRMDFSLQFCIEGEACDVRCDEKSISSKMMRYLSRICQGDVTLETNDNFFISHLSLDHRYYHMYRSKGNLQINTY